MAAGHCVKGGGTVVPANAILVGVGYTNEEDFNQGEHVEVQQVIAHEDFDDFESLRNPPFDPAGLGLANDISLLVLRAAPTRVTPAPILARADVPSGMPDGTVAVVSGYGVTHPNAQSSGELYIAETTIDRRGATEVLTLSQAGQGDACYGDSGGPLYVDVDDTRYVIGVTSRLRSDATVECGQGGIYTLAPSYIDWIVRHAGDWYAGEVPDDDPNVGAMCDAAENCFTPAGTPTCFSEDQGFSGGYCTGADCLTDADCGGDAMCLNFGQQTYCLDGCVNASDCRAGYPCIDVDGDPETPAGVCYPSCSSDTECAAGQGCGSDGYCHDAPNGTVVDVGSACADDGDCNEPFGLCIPDEQYPGGYCTTFGCRGDQDCDGDAFCLTVDQQGSTFCFDGCQDAYDCRAGYACLGIQSDPMLGTIAVCTPDCVSDSECRQGQICSDSVCTDTFEPDAGVPDSGTPDSGTPDSGTPDSGTPDSGTPDSGTPDASQPDSGTPDASVPDASQPDASHPDAAQPDAAQPDAGQPEPDAGQFFVDGGIDDDAGTGNGRGGVAGGSGGCSVGATKSGSLPALVWIVLGLIAIRRK